MMCSKAKEKNYPFVMIHEKKQNTPRNRLVHIFHDLKVSEKNLKDLGEMMIFGVTLFMSMSKFEMEVDKKVKI